MSKMLSFQSQSPQAPIHRGKDTVVTDKLTSFVIARVTPEEKAISLTATTV